MPPPHILRLRRISGRSSFLLRTMEPTGAPNALLKQTEMVSAISPKKCIGTRDATAAFQIRAPSICKATLCSRASRAISRRFSRGYHAPPPLFVVFSKAMILVRGSQSLCPRNPVSTNSGVNIPCLPCNSINWMPDKNGPAADS